MNSANYRIETEYYLAFKDKKVLIGSDLVEKATNKVVDPFLSFRRGRLDGGEISSMRPEEISPPSTEANSPI